MEAIDRLTKEQCKFLDDKLTGYETICVTIHGSTLYGLEHSGSDLDIKAVYVPTRKDLLLGNGNKTYNHKCDELGIEIEIKSLPSFIKSLEKCDTNCLDMINTPNVMTLRSSDLWESIKQNSKCVYAKNMKGIIGYIKTHTHKYSNKIQRLEELVKLQEYLLYLRHYHNIKTRRLVDINLSAWITNNDFKYISLGTQYSDHEQAFLEVCGKKYTLTWSVATVLDAVTAEINRYGKRTNSGTESGMDGKALSHALRGIVEVKDIIENNSITFPLREAELVRKVKFNQIPLDEVIELLDIRFNEVNDMIDNSDLPEFNDLSPIFKLLEDFYFEH